ncbi:MAG: isochorismatase family protein, partial [Chloroflexi bacterium]|nr:isochorismatase family protein [Chloroflexota bacterium]
MQTQTALILIDVQVGLDDARLGARSNPAAEANMARLLQAWRRLGRPIFHIQHMSTEPNSPLRPELPGNAIKTEVAPLPGEPIIQKRVNCAFIGTDLQERLDAQGIQSLLFVGLTTEHCVSTSARIAGDLGYEVFVAADATASHECLSYDGSRIPAETVQAVALANLHREFATVRSTADILKSVSNPANMASYPTPLPADKPACVKPSPASSGGAEGGCQPNMKIALISSLYRCERHLPTFSAALIGFAKVTSQAGLDVHYLPILNAASPAEREQIDKLARAINAANHGRMTPHYVARESLYASWNRGLAHSDADVFGFWNADDIRAADAFFAGYRALQAGADLVDFDFTRVRTVRRLRLFPRTERLLVPCLYDPARFNRRNGIGPFFIARRSLYDAVGPFDGTFQIAGDTEWASRAFDCCHFQRIASSGGDFIVHGDNLSNTGSGREDIEVYFF